MGSPCWCHQSIYDPNCKFPAPFVPAHIGIPLASPVSMAITEADSFHCRIRCDVNHYDKFCDEKQWDVACPNFEAATHSHGTANILNKTYIPTAGNPSDLDNIQKDFMYTIFTKKLLTDKGQLIMRQHEAN